MDHSLPGSSISGFSRQEYLSGLPFFSPRGLPRPGIEPTSLALAGGFFTTEPPRMPCAIITRVQLRIVLSHKIEAFLAFLPTSPAALIKCLSTF